MFVFFDLEGLVFIFQNDRDDHVGVFVIRSALVIIRVVFDKEVIHPVRFVRGDVVLLHFGSKVFTYDGQEFTLLVHHRDVISEFVLHKNTGDILLYQSSKVIRTKGLGQVHDARTVFGSHVVTRNHGESGMRQRQACNREELLIFPAQHRFAFEFLDHLVRDQLITWGVVG